MHCDEDQILCSVESPGKGCPGQDVCVPRGVDDKGDLCPGFCPIECKDDQLKCQTPIDPITKCAKPTACVSKSKDDKGNLCPNQQCPLHCEETEIKCTGAPTTLGCKEEDTCAARGKSVSDDLCPGKCPVTCDPIKEIKCNCQ